MASAQSIQQLQQQAIQSTKNAREQTFPIQNYNALFAHNSAPSSSHISTNGKISSIVGLKQIINPQQLMQNLGTRKSSAVNNSHHNSDIKASMNMNFSQGNIPKNQIIQGNNIHNNQIRHLHQRSLSNSKVVLQKGNINLSQEQSLKSNSNNLGEVCNGNGNVAYFQVTSYNQQNSLNPDGTSYSNEPGYNAKHSSSPTNQVSKNQNQQPNYLLFDQVENPLFLLKQNCQKQKDSNSSGGSSFAFNSSTTQLISTSQSSAKNSLNIKRPKLSSSNTNGNQAIQNQISSLSPYQNAHFGQQPLGLDKQDHLQSIERNSQNSKKISGSQITSASTSTSNGQIIPKQNKIGISSSEHKININQSQSIRKKMNINSIISSNQGAYIPQKNDKIKKEGDVNNINIRQNSPDLINLKVENIQNINNSFSLNSNLKEEEQQHNMSNNGILQKPLKSKMNPFQSQGGQQQLQQNSQQQLQNLIQSRSSQFQALTNNQKDSSQLKTFSLSGHLNTFYSPNTYTKNQPTQSKNNIQNNTVDIIHQKIKRGKQNNSKSSSVFTNSYNQISHFNSNLSVSKPTPNSVQIIEGMSFDNPNNIKGNQLKQTQSLNQEIMLNELVNPSDIALKLQNNNQTPQSNGVFISQQNFQEAGISSNQPTRFNKFPEQVVLKMDQEEFIVQKDDNQQKRYFGFSSTQQNTCNLIMGKLEKFDASNSRNLQEHISEIVNLLHLSLVDTPLQKVIEKFEENVALVNKEIKQRDKQQQQSIGIKQKEIETLQKQVIVMTRKLDKMTNINNKKDTYNHRVDQVTQTSPKKKNKDTNNKNSIIQICDQNGNVQEVDTDKENDMLRDYILEQEKKVNVFKDKEGKMIKLLLAIKKKGIDIDEIYNEEIDNQKENEKQNSNSSSHSLKLGGKKTKVDGKFFKKLDNDEGLADNSIVNDSDESSFGFLGKPTQQEQEEESIIIKQKSNKTKKPNLKEQKQLKQKMKLNLARLNDKKSDDEDYQENEEEKENRLFYEKILSTLNITQEELDKLQDQIQNDPQNLSSEQLEMIQLIHSLQIEREKQVKSIKKKANNQVQSSSSSEDKDEFFFNQENDFIDSKKIIRNESILPPELKEQISINSKLIDFNNNNNDDDEEEEEEEEEQEFFEYGTDQNINNNEKPSPQINKEFTNKSF